MFLLLIWRQAFYQASEASLSASRCLRHFTSFITCMSSLLQPQPCSPLDGLPVPGLFWTLPSIFLVFSSLGVGLPVSWSLSPSQITPLFWWKTSSKSSPKSVRGSWAFWGPKYLQLCIMPWLMINSLPGYKILSCKSAALWVVNAVLCGSSCGFWAFYCLSYYWSFAGALVLFFISANFLNSLFLAFWNVTMIWPEGIFFINCGGHLVGPSVWKAMPWSPGKLVISCQTPSLLCSVFFLCSTSEVQLFFIWIVPFFSILSLVREALSSL